MKNMMHLTLLMAVIMTTVPMPPVLAKMDWEPLDASELQKTSYAEAPGEPAVILFDKGNMTVGPELIFERYCRTRILSEAGYKYADIHLFYREDNEIEDLEARTILPDGRIIKLEKKDFLRNRIKFGAGSMDMFEIVFAFPSVEPGCVVEYKFSRKSSDISFLDKWYFQNEIYTFHSEMNVKVLSVYVYNYYLFPPGIIPMPAGRDVAYPGGGGMLNYGLFTWELNNIAKAAPEPLSPPVSSTRTQIFFALSSIPVARRYYFNSWENTAKIIYNILTPGLRDAGAVKAAAEQCTAQAADSALTEKVDRVFRYIKQNCEYKRTSQQELFFAPPEYTLEKKEGGTADLSALMIQMLRDVDVRAYPAMIPTRNDPPFLRNFPSPTQFNKLIVYVPGARDTLWINPAGSLSGWRALPWQDQGQPALVLDSEHGSFSRTPVSSAWQSMVSHDASMTVAEDGSVTVDGRMKATGLCADECIEAIRNRSLDERKKYILERLGSGFADGEVTSLTVPEDLKACDSLTIGYSVRARSGAKVVSERIMFSPHLGVKCSSEPFAAVKRSAPVFFEYPYAAVTNVRINLPEGYELESGLKDEYLERDFGTYGRRFEKSEGTLAYMKTFVLDKPVFPVSAYMSIRSHYQQLEVLDNEEIVLKKSAAPAK